jgi:hypothetical protein
MSKHRNKGATLPPQQRTNIIPGLGVDVPELQRERALWQLNRFDEAPQIFESLEPCLPILQPFIEAFGY